MDIPGTRICDLCRNPIDAHKPHPQMTYPLGPNDVAMIQKDKPKSPGDVFGFMAHVGTPKLFRFDFCLDCVDGILPDLARIKTEQIEKLLAERAQHAAGVIDDDD